MISAKRRRVADINSTRYCEAAVYFHMQPLFAINIACVKYVIVSAHPTDFARNRLTPILNNASLSSVSFFKIAFAHLSYLTCNRAKFSNHTQVQSRLLHYLSSRLC